jgi:hypothetical protein
MDFVLKEYVSEKNSLIVAFKAVKNINIFLSIQTIIGCNNFKLALRCVRFDRQV